MTTVPLPPGTMPRSFSDPTYASLARMAEDRLGLPKGILDAIRLRGERSNADQVSSAGARSPYQFIPATRQGMIKNYGVDPWVDAQSSTNAAGLLLKENYGRSKSWDTAIAQYHGGLDPRNHGPRTRAYTERVGSFDNNEEQAMSPAYRDLIEIPDSYNPNYIPPEPPQEAVPIPNSPGMSRTVPATAPVAQKKRRGLLGGIGRILENVFMPEPDSRWAAALRGGIYDAKANQAKYKQEAAAAEINNQMANAKLKNLLTKGEYQIAGNNVVHFPPNGGPPEIITPPATQGEKERLIDRWSRMSDADPAKQLIEDMLRGSNADPVLQNRKEVARIRAGATTSSARIRANAPSKSADPTKLPSGYILDK